MQVISSDKAPKAIGPYSQAIKVGDWLYTSGQVSLDPATGNLVDGDFLAQVHQTFANLKNVLAAAGMTFQNVVKATVYLTDMANFQTMNAVYADYMGDHKPARTTIAVVALPKEAAIEIDFVATTA
jgi:2-iminobutanoate/2-iminopropanoate deaminase